MGVRHLTSSDEAPEAGAAAANADSVALSLKVGHPGRKDWLAEAARAHAVGDDRAAVAHLERILNCPDATADDLDRAQSLAERCAHWLLAAQAAARAAEIAAPSVDRLARVAVLCNLAGDRVEAIRWGERAWALDPENVENSLQLGALYNTVGLHSEALDRLTSVIRADPKNLRALCEVAYAAERLGRTDKAASFVLRAHQSDIRDQHIALHAAHLLIALNRWGEAREVLSETLEAGGEQAVVLRTLSGVFARAGEYAEAIDAIDKSIALDPGNVEFLVHKAGMLLQIGLVDEADVLVSQALEFDPRDPVALRFKIEVEMQRGDYDRAVTMSAFLITITPDREDSVACMQHALSMRGRGGEMDAAGILEAKRRAPPRPPRPPRTFADGFRTQRRVMGALLLREVRTRFGESRFGYVWALLEIAIHIGVLALIFPFTMHGKPPIGDSFFFFYFTGLVPYLLFSHVVGHVGHAIQNNRPMLELPQVTNIDVILARGLLEFATILVVAGIFLVGFVVFDVPSAIPYSPGDMMAALFVSWALGMGFGAITAIMNVFTHVWDSILQVLIRLLYFASGIFYVPAMMPEWVRDIFVWNPLLHTIDWFRISFFKTYQPHWFDYRYPVVMSVVLILIAMGLEYILRKQIKLAK